MNFLGKLKGGNLPGDDEEGRGSHSRAVTCDKDEGSRTCVAARQMDASATKI